MKWRKLGRVFVPDGTVPWMRSHASNPVALPVDDRAVTVFFSTRDGSNRSHVASLELEVRPHPRVRHVGVSPLLAPGEPGAFDDSGISVGCIDTGGDALRLFYVGWNLGVTVPFRNSIGSATWDPSEGRFERDDPGPLFDRSREDPYSLSYPMIVREDGGAAIWYGSHLRWGASTEDMVHAIKVARSADGVTWSRNRAAVLAPREDEGEIALARPWVIVESGLHRMWYSRRRRSGPYRLGYAESSDGIFWTRRDDETGLEPSIDGWDGEGVSYPSLFDLGGERYMLYCGNGYGRDGFGIAVLEQD